MADVYCSTKFRELEVHIQSRQLYNCCKAYPERIDLKWLENNPGQLFNTPTMVRDRELMLSGQKCHSCDWGCYRHEDKGLISSRSDRGDRHKVLPQAELKTLKIALSTDCNLTCAYCSAEWSTAWSNELSKNGRYGISNYDNSNRNWNALWKKIKQKDRGFRSNFFNLIKREIKLSPSLYQIYVMGGEPLLNNDLEELLDDISDRRVVITTGLGVSPKRLDDIIPKIKSMKDCILDVSIEATGEIFEFIRYGCSWDNFQTNLHKLLDNGIRIRFGSVICNLSSFGLIEFYRRYHNVAEILQNPVTSRPFLEVNVLDEQSKLNLIQNAPNNDFFNKIKKTLSVPYEQKQFDDLKIFLFEFSRRRNIELKKIFPAHFLEWLGLI